MNRNRRSRRLFRELMQHTLPGYLLCRGTRQPTAVLGHGCALFERFHEGMQRPVMSLERLATSRTTHFCER